MSMVEQSDLDVFKAALAKWVEAALAHMRPNIDKYVMHDVDIRWRLNDDGYYRRLPVENIGWVVGGFPNRDIPAELQALPAYQELLKLVEKIHPLNEMVDNVVGTSSSRHRYELFSGLAVAALPPAEAVVNGQTFSVLNLCEAALNRTLMDEWPITDIAYINGLSMECDSLELQDGVQLMRLTPPEVIGALRFRFFMPDSEDFPVFQLHRQMSFGLKRTRVERRVIGEATPMSSDELENTTKLSNRLLESLVLMTDQTIRIVGELTPHDGVESLTGAGGFSYRVYPASRVWREFRLDDDGCKRLQQLWARPKMTSRHGKALDLAIRRLSLAILRDQWEDRLLDLFIAAEAFYLTDVGGAKDKGELKYRLALRAAVWAGDDLPGWTRREVFDHLKRGYDLRSAIVHGSTPEAKDIKVRGQQVELQAFVLATQEILRGAFYKAVLQAISEGGRLSIAWDDMILPG